MAKDEKSAGKDRENAFLLRKYREVSPSSFTLCEFCRSIKSELSEETWATVLHRKTGASVKTLIVMAYELNCSNQEIVALLQGRKEYTLAKLISRDEAPPTREEQQERHIVAKLRRLREKDPKKVTLVSAMIDSLLK
jgi:hypothetical protein